MTTPRQHAELARDLREKWGAADTINTLRNQLAEAQRDSERLDWMIEQRAYVVSDPDCCDGYWLRYQRHDGTLWVQATEHATPRAAIDAAMGRAFEAYINPDADIDLHWQSAGYYAGRGVQQSWLDFQAGHAAAKAEDAALLGLLADIRAAAGDPTGKLMQCELVALIAGLRAGAETAEVEEPLFWFRPSSVNGLYEGPLHNAQIEQVRKDSGAWVPLYTASKLAAAVAAERDYWRNELHALLEAADAVATNNAHAVSIGSVRYAKHSQTWKAYASLDRARQRASDAIRAGAKEHGE